MIIPLSATLVKSKSLKKLTMSTGMLTLTVVGEWRLHGTGNGFHLADEDDIQLVRCWGWVTYFEDVVISVCSERVKHVSVSAFTFSPDKKILRRKQTISSPRDMKQFDPVVSAAKNHTTYTARSLVSVRL